MNNGLGRDLRDGALSAAVLLPSIALYSAGFGIVAGTAGLSLVEATLFSGWVYAGAAQMASLQGWAYPVPVLFVCLTTLAMNARYLLMGATLRPLLAPYPASASYFALFFLGDLNWAMALRRRDPSFNPLAFLLGSGLAMWLVWVAATMAGHGFGQILDRPERFGVDFMLAAFFMAMAVTFWKRGRQPAPLLVAVLVAILAEKTLDGPWYILLGALAGSVAGVFRRGRAR
ncbi:MAG: AzlC family ABC transporter permease [Rhodospirillales bacterium]|nr:AzlC family ABC transporter permease [Rhodospirillales bacterium]